MISVHNLKKAYKDKKILDDVSLQIISSNVTFLMGKNGAGKSTFIKCLLNLEDYKGEILFDNKPYNNSSSDVFAIYDDSALYKNLSGLDNVRLISEKSVSEIKEISMHYVTEEMLNKKAKYYSYGEKKKIFIIIVELLQPKVIIMDEVSNGLDYETMVHVKKQIAAWGKRSTVLLTGHHFDFYRSIIDSLLIINNGQIEKRAYDAKEALEDIYENIAA